jgi:hypothetical protein
VADDRVAGLVQPLCLLVEQMQSGHDQVAVDLSETPFTPGCG